MAGWHTHNINCCKHFILYHQQTVVYTTVAVMGVPAPVPLRTDLQWADSLQLPCLSGSISAFVHRPHSPQGLNMARVLEQGCCCPMQDSLKGNPPSGTPHRRGEPLRAALLSEALLDPSPPPSLHRWRTYVSV